MRKKKHSKVEYSAILVLTVGETEGPEAGYCDLGQVLVLSGSIVARIWHLLLGEEPLVGRDGHSYDGQGYRGGEGGHDLQAGTSHRLSPHNLNLKQDITDLFY